MRAVESRNGRIAREAAAGTPRERAGGRARPEESSAARPNGAGRPEGSSAARLSGGRRPEVREKREQFEEEALSHLEELYGYGLRLTGGDEAEAEDLVQRTMLRAYRSWDTYDLGTNCGAWLHTILRNCFVNEYRKKSRDRATVPYEKVEGHTRFDGEGAPFERPDRDLFGEMIDDEVVGAIEDLPEIFRVPLVLVDLEGLSYGEAAESLGVPVGTVKSRLHRARRRLRDELADYAREMGYVRPGAGERREGSAPGAERGDAAA